MAEEMTYLQELALEKDSLDPSFVHAQRLLLQGEISLTFPFVYVFSCVFRPFDGHCLQARFCPIFFLSINRIVIIDIISC